MAGEPERPPMLSEAAGRVWAALVGVVGAGVLTRDNGQTLARYCHGLVRWWKLADWLDCNEDTYEVEDKIGNVRHVRHPNVITYEKLGRDLTRIEQEFGLTPASRTRIHAVLSGASKSAKPAAPDGAPPVLKIAK